MGPSGSYAEADPGRCLEHRPRWPFEGAATSVQAISWVLEQSQSTLGARLVLLSIANHAKNDGTGAWPSLRTIAREAHLSEREVRYSLRKLEKSGELKSARGKGPHGTNLYSLAYFHRGAKFAGGKIRQEGGKMRHQGGQPIAPEPSLKQPSLKQSKPEQPRLGSHSPEQIRQIEAKQKRLQVEAEVARELYVGAGPMCADRELMAEVSKLAARKSL